MNSWTSYPSIFNVGHKAIQNLFTVPVNVEEKIDGSQFSFGRDFEGFLQVRSKGAIMQVDAPEKMFSKAVETVMALKYDLVPGWTYRAEYLQKPKHNTLAYNRVPEKHLIIFDINTGDQEYLSYAQKKQEAARLGLECVPLLRSGMLTDISEFNTFLETDSILGGQKIEGVVIKPAAYNLWGEDKKVLMGKHVSEAFKEIHQNTWRQANPGTGDIVQILGEKFRTSARWQKAVQHLREAGMLEESPRDIGNLIKETQRDVLKECEDEIKASLFKYAWPHIQRKITAGLPEWYKEELLKKQFEN